MTDEEKLAIEIVNNLDTEIYDCEGSCVSIYDYMKSACLAGIKASKPKWHDLRKYPNDLPKKNDEYYCYVYECGYEIHRFNISNNCFLGVFSRVIAWCELPEFKE